jgi:glycine cleavage system regulatory protein
MLRRLATNSARALLNASASAPPTRASFHGSAAPRAGQVLVHMSGLDCGEIFSKTHKAICGTGGEIKESRSCRLGGRFSQMFLVADGDAEKIKAALAKFDPEHLDVDHARQTSKDIKGPYCRTSPLVPFVRKAHFSVPWKRGVVDDITELLNADGVTMTDFDEYRAGKDVDLQGFAHLPTGLAEFPQVNESALLAKLEAMGVRVMEFDKVQGQEPPTAGAAAATA